jgi:diguanylate cyclase (GGDEF)-like protein/PAS domain S-box-containing protein
MALVSLVDEDRQWFKARLGLDVCSSSREVAFCAHAVAAGDLLVVEDATLDERFANNPLVTGAPYIRFYAGAPLITGEGHVLGTLCVLDTTPRRLTHTQVRLLRSLSHQVMDQLEHRRQADAMAAEMAGHEVARLELSRQKQFDAAVLEAVNAGVLACDADGNVVLRNAAQRRLTALRDDEDIATDRITGRIRLLTSSGIELPADRSPLRQALAGRELADEAMQIGLHDGTLHEVLVTARQIRDDAGGVLGAVAAFTDITSERQVQAQLKEGAAFHDAVLAASPDIIYVVDPRNNRSVWSSRNLTAMLGYSERQLQELGDSLVKTLVHPSDVAGLRAANSDATQLPDGEVLQLRYRARHASGEWVWLSRRVTPFARDEHGGVTQLLAIARDITELVRAEERLEVAALHDSLTGLPNRMLLADRLHSALSRLGRSSREVAVLFCDLDGFKQVNDTGGHAAGDAVLRVTAERLHSQLRGADTVARVGGDEFVVIVESGADHGPAGPAEDLTAIAHAVASRIMRSVSAPIIVNDVAYSVTTSIGITLAQAGASPEDVLRAADTAMYRAKSLGKNRSVVAE